MSNDQIPKIIHYVWMGKGKKSNTVNRCINTWKKQLKDYQIIEWNENNFDINSHPFVKRAYELKQWAFVSDYIRFYAVYNYGGIYFDTDVTVVRNIDELLNNKAFVGFEQPAYPFTAVFGAVKRHPFCKRILEYYDEIDIESFKFKFEDNNTIYISNILINEYGCMPDGQERMLKNDIMVYKSTKLCIPSSESLTIHLFTATWTDGIIKNNFKRKVKLFLLSGCTNRYLLFQYLIIDKCSETITEFFFHLFKKLNKSQGNQML